MTTRHRTELIVEREYRPDVDRCVRAVMALLTYRAPDPSPQNEAAESVEDSAAVEGR
jgi:hypothetical protein